MTVFGRRICDIIWIMLIHYSTTVFATVFAKYWRSKLLLLPLLLLLLLL